LHEEEGVGAGYLRVKRKKDTEKKKAKSSFLGGGGNPAWGREITGRKKPGVEFQGGKKPVRVRVAKKERGRGLNGGKGKCSGKFRVKGGGEAINKKRPISAATKKGEARVSSPYRGKLKKKRKKGEKKSKLWGNWENRRGPGNFRIS